MKRSAQEMEDIKSRLDDCLNVINISTRNGGPGYDGQSKQFLRDMAERINDEGSTWISKKQLKWLDDLHEKI